MKCGDANGDCTHGGRKGKFPAALLCILLCLCANAATVYAGETGGAPAPVEAVAVAPAPVPAPAKPLSPEEIAAHAAPATVGVYCQKNGDRYYGTGVLIDPRGYLLTSTTVVPEGATNIEVYLSDHTHFSAVVIEASPPVETVLLRIDAGGRRLSSLTLARMLPEIGAPAYTLGNAGNMIKLGDGASFSAGVVSGLYEIKSVDSQSGYSGLGIETDAAVNAGQDGGPLLDGAGRVIGILSRSYSPVRWQGVAVPVRHILAYMKSFVNGTIPPELITTGGIANTMTGIDDFSALTVKIAPALVALEVERVYPPEQVKRRDWVEYRNSIEGWDKLPDEKRNRLAADFFAADSLLAANQMLRRPAGQVTGLLVSASGYILTSAFNVQSGDMIYLRKDERLPRLPEYEGDIRKLYGRSSDEYTKTSNRVTRINAILPGGHTVAAEIVGFDLALGVALLKVESETTLPFFDIARESATARAGEPIALLGTAPTTQGHTANTGIISATERDQGRLLQFDALLNYGNSGGPLINRAGKFIGLAASPLNPAPLMGKLLPFRTPEDDPGARALSDFPNSPNSGIGMAAAAERIVEALPALQQGAEQSRRGGVKLGFQPTTDSAFAARVVVGQVQTDSPAERSGLKEGDEILTLDGLAVRSWQEIRNYLREKQPGETVTFEVFRALGKPYLFLNGKKFEKPEEIATFIATARDGEKVEGNIYRPGVKQPVYILLGQE